jgi:hypothetical protein
MKSKYDNSFCTLCKQKIAVGIEITKHNDKWCHDSCVKAQGSTDAKPAEAPPTESLTPPTRPEINPNLKAFVTEEAIVMLQIQEVCKEILGLGTTGQQLGLWTKEIYRESKKVKFEKP